MYHEKIYDSDHDDEFGLIRMFCTIEDCDDPIEEKREKEFEIAPEPEPEAEPEPEPEITVEIESTPGQILNQSPKRYERKEGTMKTMTIQCLTFTVLCIDVFIFVIISQYWINFHDVFSTIQSVFFILFLLFTVIWLHYKIQHIVFGFYEIFMDLETLKTNRTYYSGVEISDRDPVFYNQSFPAITIQLPVYKENLDTVIRPTVLSALREAERYLIETGSPCNFILCDDGYYLISEEERARRLNFYREKNLGVTIRPHPAHYPRKGRFKKAGNLNFSMNYGPIYMNFYYMNFSSSTTDYTVVYPHLLQAPSKKLYESYCKVLEKGAILDGNLFYAPYIFLIDSDTRFMHFPKEENGCFKRMIKDLMYDGKDNVLYSQCYTAPFLNCKSLAEKCVFHTTCHIYNEMMIGTSMGGIAPLVGHNVLLNKPLLQKIAEVEEETDFIYYWGENRISEDFDCMLRGCSQGYHGRYVSSAGIYYEGISLNYMTEYFKVCKFACGSAEILFRPVASWFSRPCYYFCFSQDIIRFLQCSNIEWYNKLGMVVYLLNYLAVAQAHIAMFYNLLFFRRIMNVLPFILIPVNLMWEGIIVWGGVITLLNLIFSLRMGFPFLKTWKQQMYSLLFTSALYGSLSVRFSIMYAVHLFQWKIEFGATQKDHQKVTLLDWVRSTSYECQVYTFYLICILVRVFFFREKSYLYTFYFGGLPLFMCVFWYWTGPMFFDILPSPKDKTHQPDYDAEEHRFRDKYRTLLPFYL